MGEGGEVVDPQFFFVSKMIDLYNTNHPVFMIETTNP